MLTIFCSPKPFVGAAEWNQINALRSWRYIHPSVEILMFGAVSGAEDAAKEVNAIYIPEVECSSTGAPSFNSMAEYARVHGLYDLQVYANADILFNSTLAKAMQLVSQRYEKFLLVGERMDLSEGIIFDTRQTDWINCLRSLVDNGHLSLHGPTGVDYFGFHRNMWQQLLPVYMGRACCDQALLNYSFHNHIPVIDASLAVLTLHQFHGYNHLSRGRQEVFEGEDCVNMKNAHGLHHSVPLIADADLCFSKTGNLISGRFRRSMLRELELILKYNLGLQRISVLIRGLQYARGLSKVYKNKLSMEMVLDSWKTYNSRHESLLKRL